MKSHSTGHLEESSMHQKNSDSTLIEISDIRNQILSIYDLDQKAIHITKFFMIMTTTWVISFSLAFKDDSLCLSDTYSTLNFTFKTWHTLNFAIAMGFIFSQVVSLIPFNFCECWRYLIFALVLFVTLIKVVWMIVGVLVFLIHVNFDRCSERVIVYTTIQILVSLLTISYFLVKQFYVHKKMAQKQQKILKMFGDSAIPLKDPLRQMLREAIDTVRLSSSSIFGNTYINNFLKNGYKIFNQINQQVIVWAFLGWTFSIVLAGKDHHPIVSGCLDSQYGSPMKLSLREWLWGDGSSTLILTFFAVILAYRMKRTQNNDDEENGQNETLTWRLFSSIKWLKKDPFFGSLVLVCMLLKAVWLLVGYVLYFNYVSVNICREFTMDYMVIYLGWVAQVSTFLAMFLIATCFKGSLKQEKNEI